MTDETAPTLLDVAGDITIAWLGNANTRVAADEVPAFLRAIHATLAGLAGAAAADDAQAPASSSEYEPAVSVRRSLASREHIISMIDGKAYKTLRRHLSTHGLTPQQYRERYGLKSDYPMVAPAYSEARSALAKKIGLGSKGRGAKPARKPRG